MGEWHEFYLAEAGAAAVLSGLVFVGVSINLDMIMSESRLSSNGPRS